MKITGWHGGPKKLTGRLKETSSSEGRGVYIAQDQEFAKFFGHPHRVVATVERPLFVDHEDLPVLEDRLMWGWFNQMRRSVWIDANRHASESCGLLDLDYDQDPTGYLELVTECIPSAITDYLLERGYDSLRITVFGGRIPDSVDIDPALRKRDIVWWVVFDPAKVRKQA